MYQPRHEKARELRNQQMEKTNNAGNFFQRRKNELFDKNINYFV